MSAAATPPPVTRRLAEFVVGSRFGDISGAVRHEARRSLLNWVGCAVGGSRDETVDVTLAVADAFSGPRQATVLGRAERLDGLNAAFVNAISSSVHTFDDTHLATLTHPTGPIASALLALAELRPLAGAGLLHALVLGMEVECRLGNMLVAPPAKGSVGWFVTGLTGAVGAAVAVAKALSLNPQQVVWAIGNAVLQAAGVREVHATMGHSFPPGHAARAGLLAALLAERGFTSAERSIEGPKGFGSQYAERPHFDAVTDGLGAQFELLRNTYKPYPCGIVAHPAIDACLDAIGAAPVPVDRIRAITVRVHPLALELTGRPEPANSFESKYSLQHWIAAALVFGAAGVEQGVDAVVHDPAIVALRKRVRAIAVPECSRDEAAIEIALHDAPALTAHVQQCRGSAGRPMSDAELEAKFHGQVDPVNGRTAAERTLQLCWQIDGLTDAAALARSAAGAAPAAGPASP